MWRRDFLQISGLLAAGCAARAAPRRATRIRAVAFDLFTIFDPRSIAGVVRARVGERSAELVDVWRAKQFEYAFIRASAGQYRDFRAVTEDALDLAAAKLGVALDAGTRRVLVDAYSALEPWPDAARALGRMKEAGLVLTTLANFTPEMIERLLAHAGFTQYFDHQLSTDAVRTYKPDPRAYRLAVDRLGLAASEIAFSAFGGWDAAGAAWFGFPTFWVNRLDLPAERLVAPTATGASLDELATWVAQYA